MISIATSISNPETKQHITELLSKISASDEISVVDIDCQSKCLTEWLQSYYTRGTDRFLILISDVFANPETLRGAKTLATDYQAEFGECHFGTIAITLQRQRLPDIDRTIPPDVNGEELGRVIDLVANRIRYVAAPQEYGPLSDGICC